MSTCSREDPTRQAPRFQVAPYGIHFARFFALAYLRDNLIAIRD